MVLDPLAQFNLVTIGAVIVIVLATLLILRRTFFLPLIEVMERRAARIASARAQQAAGEAALKAADAEVERLLAAERDQAAVAAERLRVELAGRRTERLARAGAEAEAILARGRAELPALQQAEEARLQAELCDCVTRTLTRTIGSADESAVRFMVNRVLGVRQAEA